MSVRNGYGFVRDGGIFFGFFGNGFVRDFFALGLEALEVFDAAAVLAVGLGLAVEDEGEGVVAGGLALEALDHGVVMALVEGGAGDSNWPVEPSIISEKQEVRAPASTR